MWRVRLVRSLDVVSRLPCWTHTTPCAGHSGIDIPRVMSPPTLPILSRQSEDQAPPVQTAFVQCDSPRLTDVSSFVPVTRHLLQNCRQADARQQEDLLCVVIAVSDLVEDARNFTSRAAKCISEETSDLGGVDGADGLHLDPAGSLSGWDQVTLDHLMCHTGGVPGDLPQHSIWMDLWRAPDGVTGRRLFVDWVLQRPPGKLGQYEYANGGYMLLGSVVAAVTGRCWEEDWARFVSLHLRGARGEEGLLLKPDTFTKLHQVFEGETEYARGWRVSTETWGGGQVLQHAGSNTLWLCQVWVAPKKNFACLVACNELNEGAGTALEKARQKLVERYIDTCLDVHSDLKSL
eukprot:s6370_g1.t2